MQASNYYINYSKFSHEKLKRILATARLLPSQQILRVELDARFDTLKTYGIRDLQMLQDALRTKKHVASFSQQTELSVEYLTILRREVNSYQPKPIKLCDFPDVNQNSVLKLAQRGIRNTLQLFPYIQTSELRQKLVADTNIEMEDILDLTRLSDVAQLKWVGPKFARLLVVSNYDSVEKIANADYKDFYDHIMQINEEKNINKGGLGLEDTRMWIESIVQDVSRVIIY